MVATPIGNLQDITQRALEVLGKVDLIAAEDTRHSRKLLQHYQITTPMMSLHEHNEDVATHKVVSHLQQGKSMALISDAGTPLISDPGSFLLRNLQQLGIKIVPIPGPCAVISALSVAGMPADRFMFAGFPPVKQNARLEYFQSLVKQSFTLVFYEAPHRIVACLNDLLTVFNGERQVLIARELTKTFETIKMGTLQELNEWIKNDVTQQQGEFVIVVAGASAQEKAPQDETVEQVLKVLLNELPVKQAVHLAAEITGGKRNELYQTALSLKKV